MAHKKEAIAVGMSQQHLNLKCQLYRHSHLGEALRDSLDELIEVSAGTVGADKPTI